MSMEDKIKKQIEQEALRIYPKDEGINSRGVVFDLDQAPRRAWIEGAEYGYNIKESVNVDWNKLREEFFDEHVEKNTGGYISISTAPHDLFEWFKSKLSASNQEKNGEWIDFTKTSPKEYGRYLVYRGGKVHFETWNNTGWAYNHNSITHWKQINPPKEK